MPIIKVDWSAKKLSSLEKEAFIAKTVDIVATAVKAPDHVVNVLIRDIPEDSCRFPAAVFTLSWSKTPDRGPEARAQITEQLTQYVTGISDIKPEKVVLFFLNLDGDCVGVGGKMR